MNNNTTQGQQPKSLNDTASGNQNREVVSKPRPISQSKTKAQQPSYAKIQSNEDGRKGLTILSTQTGVKKAAGDNQMAQS